MLRTILCTFLFLQVTYGWGWFKPCRFMKNTNCDSVWGTGWRHDQWNGNNTLCGSDGVTYKNRCYFTKAHCKHTRLQVLHEGACKPGDTTMAPEKPTTAKPAVVDEYCKNLLQQTCHGVNPICGTNDQSYDNECEFEKAKCFDASIHVKHLGTC